MTDLRLELADQRIRSLPVWTGRPSIVPLKGGLSNESYEVTDGGGRFVVRIGRDFPFHHVFRERELMTARAAHAAGFGPEIVHAEPGLTVSRFIAGRPFAEADVRANLEQVAHLVKAFHERMPRFVSGPGYMFWPFHVLRDYARLLWGTGNPLVARLPDVLARAERLEAAQAPLPIIFGHNDFLPANLIDDGDKIWIIDYEYAGFSTGMFDLAGLASNSSFSAEESERLLAAYFGRPPGDALRRSHAAMMCANLLREALWGLVSEIHMSAPGADYGAYAAENFARFDAAWARYRETYGDA
ncbi:MAG TPA: choline/ethanolamine kinase family protein [Devosiaceae bacterium]|nr:choline/ethanolamine kinase family protein [Devosiaceae bacterium]